MPSSRFASARAVSAAVPADRQLAQRHSAPNTAAVMDDVAFGAAASHSDAKALHLGIPQHCLGCAIRRLQGVN
jgi:hypothetical protein